MLSETAPGSGLMVQMTLILALPANEGCNILVSLEFRYGTWSDLFFEALSAKVPMTVPSVSKLG